MYLSEINLPPIIETSSSDIIKAFYTPALSASKKYDRGVGYFSSGWFRAAAKGMAAFSQNGGKARWIISPIISKKDLDSLLLGEHAKNDALLLNAILRNLEELEKNLETETLSTIAWMIADNILEIRMALPKNKLLNGEFHDKFGIFTDEIGNQISFNGSINDSMQGIINYESISIFCSWNEWSLPYINTNINRFNNLWTNNEPNVKVFEIEDAVKNKIIKLRKPIKSYQIRNKDLKLNKPTPLIPENLHLRDYQLEAIDSWFKNNNHGILEMATGTGKTITALSAVIRLLENEKRLILLILVPYKHLVEQWSEEALKFNFRPIHVAESSHDWEPELVRQIQVFEKTYQISYALLLLIPHWYQEI